jgi:hypothetical protein
MSTAAAAQGKTCDSHRYASVDLVVDVGLNATELWPGYEGDAVFATRVICHHLSTSDGTSLLDGAYRSAGGERGAIALLFDPTQPGCIEKARHLWEHTRFKMFCGLEHIAERVVLVATRADLREQWTITSDEGAKLTTDLGKPRTTLDHHLLPPTIIQDQVWLKGPEALTPTSGFNGFVEICTRDEVAVEALLHRLIALAVTLAVRQNDALPPGVQSVYPPPPPRQLEAELRDLSPADASVWWGTGSSSSGSRTTARRRRAAACAVRRSASSGGGITAVAAAARCAPPTRRTPPSWQSSATPSPCASAGAVWSRWPSKHLARPLEGLRQHPGAVTRASLAVRAHGCRW